MHQPNLKGWLSEFEDLAFPNSPVCKKFHCKFTKAGTLEEYNGRGMRMKGSSALILFRYNG